MEVSPRSSIPSPSESKKIVQPGKPGSARSLIPSASWSSNFCPLIVAAKPAENTPTLRAIPTNATGTRRRRRDRGVERVKIFTAKHAKTAKPSWGLYATIAPNRLETENCEPVQGCSILSTLGIFAVQFFLHILAKPCHILRALADARGSGLMEHARQRTAHGRRREGRSSTPTASSGNTLIHDGPTCCPESKLLNGRAI